MAPFLWHRHSYIRLGHLNEEYISGHRYQAGYSPCDLYSDQQAGPLCLSESENARRPIRAKFKRLIRESAMAYSECNRLEGEVINFYTVGRVVRRLQNMDINLKNGTVL